jgi:putative ABC transport system permease protein
VLGATRNEALAPLIRDSVRKGLIPIINQMSAAGIITLPGIMTGQILAGMDPMDAVRYQILLMFLLAGGSGIRSRWPSIWPRAASRTNATACGWNA